MTASADYTQMKQMKQARKQRRRSGARSPRIRKAGLDVRVHLLLPLRELELKPRDHRVRQLAGVSEVAVALRRLPQGGGRTSKPSGPPIDRG